MRGKALTNKKSALVRRVGFGSQVLDTTEDVSGLFPVRPLPAVRSKVLRLAGQSSVTPSARSALRKAHRSARSAGRACLGVTTGTSEGRHGSVKALSKDREGPRGVRILDAEKASVEWCAGMCSPEAVDAKRVVDPPPS